MIVDTYLKYVNGKKTVIFCTSVDHAAEIAKLLRDNGVKAEAVSGRDRVEIRDKILKDYETGSTNVLCACDLLNEGGDSPHTTVLFMARPTMSKTIYLQQLGRGLRLYDGKECLTVLDFIGQANKKYRFEEKFRALLSDSSRSVQGEIKNGFVALPKGCYLQLEKRAAEYILDNIKRSLGNRNAIVQKLATFTEDTGKLLTLENFLTYYSLDISAIYATKFSFSRLCVMAGAREDFSEPLEDIVTKALPRISAIDSRRWIEFLVDNLPEISARSEGDFSPLQLRMLTMLQFTIWQKTWQECGFSDMLEGFRRLSECPVLLGEILDVLYYNYDRIDFVDSPVDLGFECPLDLHCTYSRDQILAALDFMKPGTVREGTKYLLDKKTDVHFVTLNKAEKDYSPTTMYEDYSINEVLFHWPASRVLSQCLRRTFVCVYRGRDHFRRTAAFGS